MLLELLGYMFVFLVIVSSLGYCFLQVPDFSSSTIDNAFDEDNTKLF